MSSRVDALVVRRDTLRVKFVRMSQSKGITNKALEEINDEIEKVITEARFLRPKDEKELRALEVAGFLEPAPLSVAEGDNSFDLMRTFSPKSLNFDTKGHSYSTLIGTAGLSLHDDYSSDSRP